MFGAALIVFRESLEAALVIGIVAAATRPIARRARWIALGPRPASAGAGRGGCGCAVDLNDGGRCRAGAVHGHRAGARRGDAGLAQTSGWPAMDVNRRRGRVM